MNSRAYRLSRNRRLPTDVRNAEPGFSSFAPAPLATQVPPCPPLGGAFFGKAGRPSSLDATFFRPPLTLRKAAQSVSAGLCGSHVTRWS